MWNTFRYGQRRYNQNRPAALAAAVTVSFALSARIGTPVAGASSLSVVTTPDAILKKAVPLGGASLIKFTQASALVGAGGALLDGDVPVTFYVAGSLDLGLRSIAPISFLLEGNLSRFVTFAGNAAITMATTARAVDGVMLTAVPTVVSLSTVAPLRVDIVMQFEPVALSLVTEGRLANTLNVFGVAISAATAEASLSIGKTLASAISLSISNVVGRLGTNLDGLPSAISFNASGTIRSAGLHDIDAFSFVLLTTGGAIAQSVPLAADVSLLEVTTAADVERYNNKTLAGTVPLTLVTSGTSVAKGVLLGAAPVVQLAATGFVRNLETLAGAAAINFAVVGLVSGAVGLRGLTSNVRMTTVGSIHTYPLSLLLANAGVSDVVVYDFAVETDDGSIDVEAEVLYVDVREAA